MHTNIIAKGEILMKNKTIVVFPYFLNFQFFQGLEKGFRFFVANSILFYFTAGFLSPVDIASLDFVCSK